MLPVCLLRDQLVASMVGVVILTYNRDDSGKRSHCYMRLYGGTECWPDSVYKLQCLWMSPPLATGTERAGDFWSKSVSQTFQNLQHIFLMVSTIVWFFFNVFGF